MEALVESINSLGMYIYELHKTSCSLKEDDLNISTFAFRKIVKSHDEVSELFLKAEKDIDQRIKVGNSFLIKKKTRKFRLMAKS